MSRLRMLLAAFLLMPAPGPAQVLPPPLLPGQERIAERLVSAFAAKDLAAYAALLADDLRVYEDGERVASSKREWLDRFGPKLSASGVSFRLAPGYVSTGRLLFIEYFNSLASWGRTPPPHCCWGYDAVAYDIVGDRITAIRRLRGGDGRLGAKGERIGN